LSAIEQGDPHAAEQLLPLVYSELRKLAAHKMAKEAPGQTLEATALVHEAYLRLVDTEKAQHWDSRGHFFAAAAEAMRRILVEKARRRRRHKHGGGRQRSAEEGGGRCLEHESHHHWGRHRRLDRPHRQQARRVRGGTLRAKGHVAVVVSAGSRA